MSSSSRDGSAKVTDASEDRELVTCARCARQPRDPDDRASWATIDDAEVCPGCLTLTESEAHRAAER
jgi:hypothetical protein